MHGYLRSYCRQCEGEICTIEACKSFQGLLQIQGSKEQLKVTSYHAKEAKKEFFMRINPRNPKEFWNACKMLSWSSTSIPASQMNGNVLSNLMMKRPSSSTHSLHHVSKIHSRLANEDFLNIECSDTFPEDFLCSDNQILDMLASLDITKSNDPDNISARMLKATATSLALSVAALTLFNLSLQL